MDMRRFDSVARNFLAIALFIVQLILIVFSIIDDYQALHVSLLIFLSGVCVFGMILGMRKDSWMMFFWILPLLALFSRVWELDYLIQVIPLVFSSGYLCVRLIRGTGFFAGQTGYLLSTWSLLPLIHIFLLFIREWSGPLEWAGLWVPVNSAGQVRIEIFRHILVRNLMVSLAPIIAYYLYREGEKVRGNMFRLFLYIGYIDAGLAVIQATTGTFLFTPWYWSHLNRATGLFLDANMHALYLVFVLGITFFVPVVSSRYILPTVLIFLAGILVSGTRTTIIWLFFIGVAVLLRFTFSRKRWESMFDRDTWALVLGIGSVMLFSIWFVGVKAELARRLGCSLPGKPWCEQSISARKSGTRFAQRKYFWELGWLVFRDFPVAGVGIGSFNHIGADYMTLLGERRPPDSPLNWYITLLAEMGLTGALFSGCFFFSILKHIRRLPFDIILFFLGWCSVLIFVPPQHSLFLILIWVGWTLLFNEKNVEFIIKEHRLFWLFFILSAILGLLVLATSSHLRPEARMKRWGWTADVYGAYPLQTSSQFPQYFWTRPEFGFFHPGKSARCLFLKVYTGDPPRKGKVQLTFSYGGEVKRTEILHVPETRNIILPVHDISGGEVISVRVHPVYRPPLPDLRRLGVMVLEYQWLKKCPE